jgi:hypothetical protein
VVLNEKFRPVADWPTLLLGPMVRRVTHDDAYVFIATKEAAAARLLLYPGRVSVDAGLPDYVSTPDAAVELSKIGESFYVGLLHANLPGASVDGQVISYDVELTLTASSTVRKLADLGQLGNTSDPILNAVPLGYEAGYLPSFVVPPADIGELRIAQASCRKPHGGENSEPDAFPILDAVINFSLGLGALDTADFVDDEGEPWPMEPAPPATNRERPHQLILTGDQIYADDVPPALLEALTAASTELIGTKESVAGASMFYDEFLIRPGWRTRFLSLCDIKDIPPDDSFDFSGSHLLRFGEWCAMYVFAWSDALWARTTDGKGLDLPTEDHLLPIEEIMQVVDVVDRLQNAVGAQWIPANYVAWITRIANVADKLQKFEDGVIKLWKETRDPALVWAGTVPYVRRLLANVSTYMMFDDHEVTDDWNVHQDMADRLFGVSDKQEPGTWQAEVGPNLLRNALSAYAIFQHWGNVPDDFDGEDSKGGQLLGLWEPSIRGTGGSERIPAVLIFDEDSGTDLPFARWADELLGIGTAASPIPDPSDVDTASKAYRDQFTRFRWDYTIDFGVYRLFTLDTRTWRAFPAPYSFAWPGDEPSAGTSELTDATITYLTQVADAWAESEGRAGALGRVLQATVAASVASDVDVFERHVENAAEALTDLVAELEDNVDVASFAADLASWRADLEDAEVSYATVADGLWELSDIVTAFAKVATEATDDAVRTALGALARYIETTAYESAPARLAAIHQLVDATTEEVFDILAGTPSARDTLALAVNEIGPVLEEAVDALVPDQFSSWFFRSGTDQIAAELISAEALDFQVTGPIAGVGTEDQPTVILSPAPIFGNPLVEALQRGLLIDSVRRGLPAPEEADFEPWSGNGPALTNFVLAAAGLDRCVVLSGDVHYSNTSVNDVWLGADDGGGHDVCVDSVHTRYIQATCSSLRYAVGKTRLLGRAEDALWDDTGEHFRYQFSFRKLFGAADAEESAGVAAPDSPVTQDPDLIGWVGETITEKLEEVRDELLEEYGSWEKIEESVEALADEAVKKLLNPLWWVEGTLNSAAAWSREVLYMMYETVQDLREFYDDPIAKVFGEYVYARDILRQQLIDLYREIGVDPAYGLQNTATMLRDQRHERLTRYVARTRYSGNGLTDTNGFADDEFVQTVGQANVGLLRFVTRDDAIRSVRHELLWYSQLKPIGEEVAAGTVVDAGLPRTDWMGTVHVGAWTDQKHNLGDAFSEDGT